MYLRLCKSVYFRLLISVVACVTFLVVLWRGYYKRTDRIIGLANILVADYASDDLSSPVVTSPDHGLIHPAQPDNLWVKINEKIIIRRLAFYDTRDPVFPSVVFNVMYDDRNVGEKFRELLLYSLLTFKNGSSVCVPAKYWASTGDRANRVRFKEYFLNYILRTNDLITEAPLYGQISLSSNCSNLSINIPIKNDSVDKVYTYGVCLHKSIYNLSEPEMMVHWIELNLALGAEIMTVYLQPGYISESYYTIILPYIRRGIVEVLDWGLKPPVVPGYIKDWGQTALITECVYRNMYRVKYLGLYDLDEFIVPQKVKTIPQMLTGLEKQDQKARTTASFLSCNAYFYRKTDKFLPEVNSFKLTTNCSKLPRYYTYVVREDIRRLHHHNFHKVIVKPKAVIAVWLHHLFKHFDKLYTRQFIIPRTEGLTHHYRFPVKFKSDKTVETFTMSRYFNETVQGIFNHTCKKN